MKKGEDFARPDKVLASANRAVQESIGMHVVARGIRGDYFDTVDITLDPSEIVVIIGDNVAARDELVEVFAGHILPRDGQIERRHNARIEHAHRQVYQHQSRVIR